jgi:hypothetical protein
MRENATLATTSSGGGARLVAQCIAKLIKDDPAIEIHLIGHSAGSIFHAPLIQLLTGKAGLGLTITTCTLWAPACTVDLFKEAYVPAIEEGRIERFAMYTMTDQAELDDDCAHIYNKSLLYLVSNAFEEKERIPLFRDGWPILGMERFIRRDAELMGLWRKGKAEWVLSPNNEPVGSTGASRSTSHGGFDDDEATLKATFARIAGQAVDKAALVEQASARLMRGSRLGLEIFSNPLPAATTTRTGADNGVRKPQPKRKRSKIKH